MFREASLACVLIAVSCQGPISSEQKVEKIARSYASQRFPQVKMERYLSSVVKNNNGWMVTLEDKSQTFGGVMHVGVDKNNHVISFTAEQ